MNIRKVKVGGHSVSIIMVDKFDSELDGLCIPQSNVIKIKKGLHSDAVIETLLHEVLHFTDYVYSGYQLSEDTVKVGAKYLFYIFNHNDIFSLPDSIDLLGFRYTVVYNFKFTDSIEQLAYNVDDVEQVIRVGSNDMCNEYVITLLIRCILVHINNNYNIEFGDTVSGISQGIYQVFTDNSNFYNLFKWGM